MALPSSPVALTVNVYVLLYSRSCVVRQKEFVEGFALAGVPLGSVSGDGLEDTIDDLYRDGLRRRDVRGVVLRG